jgi:hypothetical protein
VAATITPTKSSKNGVKSYPLLDYVELERHILPVLHVTLGLANRLLKHRFNYANFVIKRTLEVLQMAITLQIEASHKYATIKEEIAMAPCLQICI